MTQPERFFDRIEKIRQNYIPRNEFKDEHLRESEGSFIRAVVKFAGDDLRTFGGVQKAYERASDPKNRSEKITTQVLSLFRSAMDKLYDGVPPGALSTEKYADFEALIEQDLTQLAKWRDAVSLLQAKRNKLEDCARLLHDQEVPDWPLLAKSEWLLDEPFELRPETSEHFQYSDTTKIYDSPMVFGLSSDYVRVRTHFDPKKPNYLTNGPSYGLTSVESYEGSLKMKFGNARYFDYVNAHELAAAELAMANINSLNDLPVRRAMGHTFDISARPSLPGVSCLLIIKKYPLNEEGRASEPRDYFWMHDRGTSTFEAQNTRHVVPAGAHQPSSKGAESRERDANIWRTVVREFLEELFNKEELAKQRAGNADFYEIADVKPLAAPFFNRQAAKAFLLGLGLDPLTLKPEISCAIVIDWPKYKSEVNKESGRDTPNLKITANYEGMIVQETLSKKNLLRHANSAFADKPCLPAGAATLLLAARDSTFKKLRECMS